MKKWGIVAVGVLLILGGAIEFIVPSVVENGRNKVKPHDTYQISQEAQTLHESIPVSDLHSDTMLWKRDLNSRGTRGHVDVPRMQESNMAIQMFTAVTKSPSGQNYESNTGDSDNITTLALAQLWPWKTLDSLLQRALYQAEKLKKFAADSNGNLIFVTDQKGLTEVLKKRDAVQTNKPVAALYGIEGAHALDGELSNVDVLFDAGVRMLGITHFFDNKLAGSLHGITGDGLTQFGRDVVVRAVDLGMIIDIAHVSPKAVDEILLVSKRPVILSHGGMKGVCDTPRNLDDALMKRVAATGGLIGIGFWDGAACDISPEGVVKSIRYAIDLLGVDHVALGSDWDGATEVVIDASELAILTQTMLDQDFSESEIRKVMGENTVAFLLNHLP